MKILQINTEKTWRGGERQTLLTMKGLRDAGVPAMLLCLKGTPLYTQACKEGYKVIGVSNHFFLAVYLLVYGRCYSVIHAQSSKAFSFAAVVSFLVNTPVVYTRRVDFEPRGVLTRWKYSRAAALVAVSNAVADILRRAGTGEATVISDIAADSVPDMASCEKLIKELGIEGRPIVGVVAALVGHKDPLTMIRAAAKVKANIPNVIFLHFGEGFLRKAAEREIDSLGLSGSYLLLGHRNGVENYFPVFDCFAMSSKEEGLGSSVLDAFTAGVPVVSTSAGGLAELVEKRGLLSAPGDSDALAENIIRILTDRSLAVRLTQEARSYVATNHNISLLTARYIDLYAKIGRKQG